MTDSSSINISSSLVLSLQATYTLVLSDIYPPTAAAGRLSEEGSVLDEAEGPGGVGRGRVAAALGPHTLPVTD